MRAPNATPENENPENLVRVRVFPNQGMGALWGPTTGGIDENGLPPGYYRTVNMTVNDGKRFTPSFGVNYRKTPYNTGVHEGSPPSFLVPWRDDTGIPIVAFAINLAAWTFKNGAAAADTDANTNVYSGACFHSDGGATDYLYVGTFSASTGAASLLNRRTSAGTWTQDDDVNAKFVASVAGALWRVTSNYEVSVCPAASEPFTAGNWGSAIQVGTAAANIINIMGLGALVVVFKEDGIYFYDESETRFINRYEVPWSPYHFPFIKPDGEGGLYTSTANGELVHIGQFGSIDTIRLLEDREPERDVPGGQIVDMTMDGADHWMLMAPSYRSVQPSGMKVLKTLDNFATFTDGTTNVTDGSRATVLDLALLNTLANGDAILVGFDDQFLAVKFIMDTGNGSGDSVMAGAVSTGAGTWATVAIEDGTATYNPGIPSSQAFSRTGVVAIDVGADISGWAKATYNGFSKYWLRLTVSAALGAGTDIAEVFIVPRRAAPSFAPTNNANGYVWEGSGVLGKVLRARKRNGVLVVDDIYTLTAVGTTPFPNARTPGANKITICALGTPNSPDGSLVIASRDEFVQYPLPPTKEPLRTGYPVLARDATNDIAPCLYPQPVDLGQGLWTVRYIEISGQDLVEETDGFKAAFRWDETNAWWVSEAFNSNHVLMELDAGGKGSRLHTAIQLLDGAITDPVAPSGRYVDFWVKQLPEAAWRHRPEARTQPEVA